MQALIWLTTGAAAAAVLSPCEKRNLSACGGVQSVRDTFRSQLRRNSQSAGRANVAGPYSSAAASIPAKPKSRRKTWACGKDNSIMGSVQRPSTGGQTYSFPPDMYDGKLHFTPDAWLEMEKLMQFKAEECAHEILVDEAPTKELAQKWYEESTRLKHGQKAAQFGAFYMGKVAAAFDVHTDVSGVPLDFGKRAWKQRELNKTTQVPGLTFYRSKPCRGIVRIERNVPQQQARNLLNFWVDEARQKGAGSEQVTYGVYHDGTLAAGYDTPVMLEGIPLYFGKEAWNHYGLQEYLQECDKQLELLTTDDGPPYLLRKRGEASRGIKLTSESSREQAGSIVQGWIDSALTGEKPICAVHYNDNLAAVYDTAIDVQGKTLYWGPDAWRSTGLGDDHLGERIEGECVLRQYGKPATFSARLQQVANLHEARKAFRALVDGHQSEQPDFGVFYKGSLAAVYRVVVRRRTTTSSATPQGRRNWYNWKRSSPQEADHRNSTSLNEYTKAKQRFSTIGLSDKDLGLLLPPAGMTLATLLASKAHTFSVWQARDVIVQVLRQIAKSHKQEAHGDVSPDAIYVQRIALKGDEVRVLLLPPKKSGTQRRKSGGKPRNWHRWYTPDICQAGATLEKLIAPLPPQTPGYSETQELAWKMQNRLLSREECIQALQADYQDTSNTINNTDNSNDSNNDNSNNSNNSSCNGTFDRSPAIGNSTVPEA